MPKMTLTVEVSNAYDLFEFLETFNTSLLNVIEEHSVHAPPKVQAALDAINASPRSDSRPIEEITRKEPDPAPPAPKRGRPAKPDAAGVGSVEPAPAPAPAPAPEPKPAPAPVSAPAPAKALPELEVLKQAVTSAVRAAQKSEGPRTILDMLPAFKKATGLDFVMNAQEEHRAALAHLVESAGLSPQEAV